MAAAPVAAPIAAPPAAGSSKTLISANEDLREVDLQCVCECGLGDWKGEVGSRKSRPCSC